MDEISDERLRYHVKHRGSFATNSEVLAMANELLALRARLAIYEPESGREVSELLDRTMERVAQRAAGGGGVAWRPEVRAFADLMELQLRVNDHKRGWKGDMPDALLERLREEADELELAFTSPMTRPSEIGLEAADVANFAMMVADVCGALKANTAPPVPAPVAPPQFFCNKCGRSNLTASDHGPTGCNYLAVEIKPATAPVAPNECEQCHGTGVAPCPKTWSDPGCGPFCRECGGNGVVACCPVATPPPTPVAPSGEDVDRAIVQERLQDRLRVAADVLANATPSDDRGWPMPADAVDDPEGTYVVKMSLLIRDALVSLLREAARP